MLQALHAFHEYHSLVREESALTTNFAKVMRELSSRASARKDIHPAYFLRALEKSIREASLVPTFKWQDQQDAREVLQTMMERIGEESPEAKAKSEMVLGNSKTCEVCGSTSHTSGETVYMLHLHVKNSLTDMAKARAKRVRMQGNNKIFCSTCKTNQDMVLKSEILVAPDVLTLVIDREVMTEGGQRRDSRRISRIGGMRLPVQTDPQTAVQVEYDTVVVMHHSGSRESGDQERGHCVAFVQQNGLWFKCDDTEVSPSSEHEAGSDSAYVVMCRKRSQLPADVTSRTTVADELTEEMSSKVRYVMSKKLLNKVDPPY